MQTVLNFSSMEFWQLTQLGGGSAGVQRRGVEILWGHFVSHILFIPGTHILSPKDSISKKNTKKQALFSYQARKHKQLLQFSVFKS